MALFPLWGRGQSLTLLDDLWWSGVVRSSLDSMYKEAPHHPLPWPPGRAHRAWLANGRKGKGLQRDLLCFHTPGSFFALSLSPNRATDSGSSYKAEDELCFQAKNRTH